MTGRGDVLADLVVHLREGIDRQLTTTPGAALHWRPAREMNSIGDTVWHIARWLDLCDSWLRDAAPETQHWIADGWAERTGYDPRGVGTDGLGVLSGYSFAEVEAIPKLRADQLRTYLGRVSDALVSRLRGTDDAAVKRYSSVIEGALGHLGEIATLRALYDRRTV